MTFILKVFIQIVMLLSCLMPPYRLVFTWVNYDSLNDVSSFHVLQNRDYLIRTLRSLPELEGLKIDRFERSYRPASVVYYFFDDDVQYSSGRIWFCKRTNAYVRIISEIGLCIWSSFILKNHSYTSLICTEYEYRNSSCSWL